MGQEQAGPDGGAERSSGSGAAEATTLRGGPNGENDRGADGEVESGGTGETGPQAENSGADAAVTGTAGAASGTDESTAASEAAESDSPKQSATSGTGDEPSAARLSLDVVFEIAKNERRRRVLQFLRDREEPVKLGELAEHIAALENDKPVKQLSSAERKRVYVGLYQCHLPKMDGAGVVNFDRNPGITLGPNAAQVTQYLDPPAMRDPRWPRLYLTEALVGLTAVVLGGALVGGAAAAVGAGALAIAMLITAIGHARDVTLPSVLSSLFDE